MAFTILTQGSFTSTGVAKKIVLPSSVDYFKTVNITQMALNPNPGVGVMFEWYGNNLIAAGNAFEWSKTNSTNALNVDLITSGGFTYVTQFPYVEAQGANAITGITAASPAVVTQTNTYSNGDYLRLYGTTGMAQIGGMVFQISSVSGSGYTLLGLDSSAFAAPGTAGYTRRVSSAAVDPESLFVTKITQASSAVVTLSIDPTPFYVVGMKVRFSVPSSFGMTQINGLTGTITAISAAAYTMTVDIDSTAFTAFAFPASTSSPTAQLFATIAPAGAKTSQSYSTGTYTGYNFSIQPFHSGQETPYMFLAAGANSPAGATSDVILWQAYKMEQTFYE